MTEIKIPLLGADEVRRRLAKVQQQMLAAGIEGALVSTLANVYYLTGLVYVGYVYLPAEGDAWWLVQRPVNLGGDRTLRLRKPEEIPALLAERGVRLPHTMALELDALPCTTVERLRRALQADEVANLSPLLGVARAVKTAEEVDMIRRSGVKHDAVYRRIPGLFREGMTDLELQIEIERESRLEGCLGLFRVAGQQMELFMGNVICGNNADAPSPYDFAMGGAGTDPSLPVGACGMTIRPGMAVMVDVNGNFTGYMTDMTRVFSLGTLPDEALRAHRCSIAIHRRFQEMCRPGVEAKSLYETALNMAKQAGLADYFMGHRQHAGFVGHGIGIEVNELPVIAPRSRHTIEEGNVIALEPKFVIPGVGAVGVENTYVVRADSTDCLTNAPEDIQPLD